MVKLYIYKLFYLLQNPSSNLKKLSSLIMNDNILKEISLQNKYKNKIRKTFGYNIENEKYKIEKISIDKEKSTFRIKISAIHSFNYINSTLKTKSSERLYFILILKKVNKLFHYFTSYIFLITIIPIFSFNNSIKQEKKRNCSTITLSISLIYYSIF